MAPGTRHRVKDNNEHEPERMRAAQPGEGRPTVAGHGRDNELPRSRDKGGGGISLGGSGVHPDSPQFQAAQKTCHMPGS
jgi:hypothetical protein